MSAAAGDPSVSRLHYARGRRQLDIEFSDGLSASLDAEFLRVFSPSAEVRGHGPSGGAAGGQICSDHFRH